MFRDLFQHIYLILCTEQKIPGKCLDHQPSRSLAVADRKAIFSYCLIILILETDAVTAVDHSRCQDSQGLMDDIKIWLRNKHGSVMMDRKSESRVVFFYVGV